VPENMPESIVTTTLFLSGFQLVDEI